MPPSRSMRPCVVSWPETTRRPRCCSPPAPVRRVPCCGSPPCTSSCCGTRIRLRHSGIRVSWDAMQFASGDPVAGRPASRHGAPRRARRTHRHPRHADERGQPRRLRGGRVSRPRPPTGRTVPWRSSSSARARGCCSASTGMPSSSPSPGSRVLLGDAASPVRCCGRRPRRCRRSPRPARRSACRPSAGRVGLDLAPVDLDDDDGVRWLEACLWPDVPGRIERFRSARDLVRRDPPHVASRRHGRGLPHAAERARALSGPDAHVVVLSSWALTYLDPTRRHELVSRLRSLAHDVPDLTWLSAEPPGCVPGVRSPTARSRAAPSSG